MRRKHGSYYVILETFYFSGLAMGVSVILLVMYFLLGWKPANIPIESLILWYSPLVIWRQIMVLWLQRYSVRPEVERGMLWTGRLMTIAVLPIYLLAFIGVVRGKRVTFKTTPKGNGRPEVLDSLRAFTPHLVIVGLLLAGMGAGIYLGHTIWVYLAWGTVTMLLYPSYVGHLLWHRWTTARRRKRAARAGAARALARAATPALAPVTAHAAPGRAVPGGGVPGRAVPGRAMPGRAAPGRADTGGARAPVRQLPQGKELAGTAPLGQRGLPR
jgi:hypothetical protein